MTCITLFTGLRWRPGDLPLRLQICTFIWGVNDDDEDDGSDNTEALTMGTGPRSGDKRPGSSRGGGIETRRKVRLDMRRASRRCVRFT